VTSFGDLQSSCVGSLRAQAAAASAAPLCVYWHESPLVQFPAAKKRHTCRAGPYPGASASASCCSAGPRSCENGHNVPLAHVPARKKRHGGAPAASVAANDGGPCEKAHAAPFAHAPAA
jgi:hypothetical protein